jgi:hypothetical protein
MDGVGPCLDSSEDGGFCTERMAIRLVLSLSSLTRNRPLQRAWLQQQQANLRTRAERQGISAAILSRSYVNRAIRQS